MCNKNRLKRQFFLRMLILGHIFLWNCLDILKEHIPLHRNFKSIKNMSILNNLSVVVLINLVVISSRA